MARVTVSEERWLDFRALAIRRKRSVAAYLGHLVQKELRRAEGVEWRRSLRAEEPVEDGTQVDDEVNENWVPPWEV
jgi:hypothetical protein